MDHFEYRTDADGRRTLFAEDCNVAELAKAHGTPCYIYSAATLTRHVKAYLAALGDYPGMICYAVKANSNLAVLNVMARLGIGFDIVSIGELERVLAAGGQADRMVFSGVGKQPHEMRRALEIGVYCFNVESFAELRALADVASSMNKTARVSVRVNPDVDAGTHPYISTGLKENKFGVSFDDARAMYRFAADHSALEVTGIDCHIGSQITQTAPFLDALEKVLAMIDELAAQGISLTHIDLGGGLGVQYTTETPPHPRDYAAAIVKRLQGTGLKLLLEPGRSIAANAGILVTRVEYLKENQGRHFALVDAAMNDLIRPSLYNAHQQIIPVTEPIVDAAEAGRREAEFDIVGPVCESGDFLGKQRRLSLAHGDLLAVRSAGAYGFVMSSNYNTRARAPEIMVSGSQHFVVRQREKIADLFAGEQVLPEQVTLG
ncbi:diaminopimelate decarboxylase [Allohahella marinimesophila]|uniref:Diaminopimelate decarboxylase n=1 Tax=Allohahella marinimesophila TaxID=1054972 RepID=A0ABP7P7G2_9GAMM